ncbi:ABC transporter ATP-binding protein [Candidatus Saccharibacteria bacterium]|nr:ABC transporter ATP-binding protein [Candidatus Saccharibacteria bacterium]
MQKTTLRLFWHYSKRYPARRAFALVFPVLAVLTSGFVGPLILAHVMNSLQTGDATLNSLLPIVALYVTTQFLGEVIFWRLALYATWTFEVNAQKDIYVDIFEKLSNESLSFHANRFSGSLVSQTNKLVGGFERFWDTIIWQAVPVITTIVATVVITSFFFAPYAIFIFIVSIVFAIAVYKGSSFMRERTTREAQASTKLGGFLADMVGNIAAVKAFSNEKSESARSKVAASDWQLKSLSSMRGFLGVSTIYSSLLVVVTGGALISAIYASEQRFIAIGTVYLLLTYTLSVSRQLWEMNSIMRNYNRIMGDSYDMVEILNSRYQLTDSSLNELKPTSGSIEFKNVHFSHDGGEGVHIFNNFSLSIRAGERVGLVGHSGSGKTTFTSLLLRFADIDKGGIYIDGTNIADVTQESLRKSIAYVPQESVLFHRPLSENISYGKPGATANEIISAAKKANAWEFISQLPEQLDTLVGERGVKLSGGQRQRIAIARAILKDAPIMILDEATSALDSDSEKLIQAALDDLMKGRTSVVIAHRLSTIAKLDRVVVLEHGKIVEDGTHSKLLEQNGVYAKLWKHQSGGFIE